MERGWFGRDFLLFLQLLPESINRGEYNARVCPAERTGEVSIDAPYPMHILCFDLGAGSALWLDRSGYIACTGARTSCLGPYGSFLSRLPYSRPPFPLSLLPPALCFHLPVKFNGKT